MAKDDDKNQISLELQGGANLSRIKLDINKLAKDNAKIDEKIGELREQKNANRQKIAAMGIPKKAFDQAVTRHKMDPEKRREHDMGYQIANEALGFALDLFTPVDEKSDNNPKSAPKASSAKRPGKGGTAGMTAPKRKPAAKKKPEPMPPTDLAGHEVPDGTIN